ncbi:MAG: hypothetical protein QF903_01735 [Planctomycetota bacterium]|jgi:hypothetical protein|nr:hypothetical protein [Planctomycetota bacterium]MDP6764309.1 hypothetical protein [Planctomycetota bacterium]MDP6988185.1 hypothetical protein [Planctomycetota bacterium]
MRASSSRSGAVLLAAVLAACQSTPELHEYKGAIHVHSLYSHDSEGTYEEILAAAKRVGLDFVIMTDHPPSGDPGLSLREGWRGIHDGVLFIQGAEHSDQILALGIDEPLSAKSRQGKIDEIHAQGGLAFIAHGEEVESWDFEGFDGMEIFNTHVALKLLGEEPGFWVRALSLAAQDPDALWDLFAEPQEVLLDRWRLLNEERPVVGIGGNDAHQNTYGLDPYWRSLGFVNTWVRAPELTQEAILDALREGRSRVSVGVDRRLGWPSLPSDPAAPARP